MQTTTSIDVIRTKYMQSILSATRENVALQACLQGTIVGAWEKLIAKELFKDCLMGHSEASEIVDSMPFPSSQAFLKAAYLITSSKIQTNA